MQFVERALPEASTKTATGLFLLGWTIFTLYMLIASLRTSGALIGVFLFLFLMFLALVLGTLAGVATFATIGGISGSSPRSWPGTPRSRSSPTRPTDARSSRPPRVPRFRLVSTMCGPSRMSCS